MSGTIVRNEVDETQSTIMSIRIWKVFVEHPAGKLSARTTPKGRVIEMTEIDMACLCMFTVSFRPI